MTAVITLRGPELVWTCDDSGNWRREYRVRIREGNGWREQVTDFRSRLEAESETERKP